MLVRLVHRSTRVLLWPAGEVACQLPNEGDARWLVSARGTMSGSSARKVACQLPNEGRASADERAWDHERIDRACAAHLRDEKLEAGPLCREVPACDHRVVVESRVRHPQVHAPIDERADAEHSATSRVERAWLAVHTVCDGRHYSSIFSEFTLRMT